MKKIYYLVFALILPIFLSAQDYYFPPTNSDEWETTSPSDLGWCADELDTLYTFLEEKNTKAFIILKDGKIVVERYFDSFTQDSIWYWASAGKTITSFLVGVAQEEGLLNINDKTSDYLGSGWTSASLEKENLITIKHQLSMTSGLDDGVPDLNCIDPACLNYLSDAGDRWSYHNAPYRLLMDVIENASGQSFQVYTFQKLLNKTGMSGLWVNRVFWSKSRNMARFGSLILNEGNWNGTQVLGDINYMNEMVNSSQNINPSYGYLWWLNGKGSFMLPQAQVVFNNDLIPNAPEDMYSALGLNDQKIYVVPSENLVVIRMGNHSGGSLFALSSFDNEVWEKLSNVICDGPTSIEDVKKPRINIYPNPVNELLYIEKKNDEKIRQIKIFNAFGQEVKTIKGFSNQIDVSNFSKGIYFIQLLEENGNVQNADKFFKY